MYVYVTSSLLLIYESGKGIILHESWKTAVFEDIKDCFRTVCKNSNEYFDGEPILIKSYSVFPVLCKIFCLQLSDKNLFKQGYCDDRNLDYILSAFMLFKVWFI